MRRATASKINIMSRLKADMECLFVLDRKSLSRHGTVHTAFIKRIPRATSNLGSTRNTNMDTPKLCAVSTHNVSTMILRVGQGFELNNAFRILSNKVNKYGEHMHVRSIQTQRSLYGS